MSIKSQSLRPIVLLTVLMLLAPLACFWLGCLQATSAGAGIARVVTPDEAAEASDATLSVRDDKFGGVRLTRLQRNTLPNPTGSVMRSADFDGVCVDHECLAVVRLGGMDALTGDYPRLDLVVDGVAFPGLPARPSRKVAGYAVEGSVVVVLPTELLQVLIAAKDVEYRVLPHTAGGGGAALDGAEGVYEGTLSAENVLNLREWLTLSGVDPWATQPDTGADAPDEDAPVGAPPTEGSSRTAPSLGSPP